jgi:hypothetical protein
MKKHFPFGRAALLFTCTALLHFYSQAQTGDIAVDAAVVDMTGQISASTCNLNISDGTSGTTGTKTLEFGNVPGGTGTFSNPGTLFGATKSVTFKLTNTDGSVCNAVSPNTSWNVILGFPPGAVAKIGSATFVKNQVPNGTNAWMLLSTGVNGTGAALVLKETMGYDGTPVAGATNPTLDTPISMTAQLASSSAAAPTPGVYAAVVPLLVLYN